MIKPILEIRNLVISYKKAVHNAVDGISLSINENDVYGLLGPNGAGKTTTISHLFGLVARQSGEVRIDQYNLPQDLLKIKQIIGVVPQEIALYKELTARENLNFYSDIYGLNSKERNHRITYFLETFGFDLKNNKRVKEYSGGMKRRLNIIAGLLHYPKILILDEPTVGVDIQTKTLILEKLSDLNSKGMTIIYTSHDLEEAQNLCSRISIIDNGKILAGGNTNEIIEKYTPGGNLESVFLKLTGRKVRD